MKFKTLLTPMLLVILIITIAGINALYSRSARIDSLGANSAPGMRPVAASQSAALMDSAQRLDQVTESLARRLDTIALQLNQLSSRLSEPRRIPLEVPATEQTAEAKEFLAALSNESSMPPGFDQWFGRALDARQEDDRQKRRLAREDTIDSIMEERMADLTSTLHLAAYQEDEVRDILTHQMSAASAIWSESSNRLESIRSMGPLREKVQTEMKAVLTPEQFTTYSETQSNGPPFRQMRRSGDN